jgi:hypothetical protein
LVRPGTVTGLAAPVALCPPRAGLVTSVAVTRYPVVGLLPAVPGVNPTVT